MLKSLQKKAHFFCNSIASLCPNRYIAYVHSTLGEHLPSYSMQPSIVPPKNRTQNLCIQLKSLIK